MMDPVVAAAELAERAQQAEEAAKTAGRDVWQELFDRALVCLMQAQRKLDVRGVTTTAAPMRTTARVVDANGDVHDHYATLDGNEGTISHSKPAPKKQVSDDATISQ
jgi:hypothetical protein